MRDLDADMEDLDQSVAASESRDFDQSESRDLDRSLVDADLSMDPDASHIVTDPDASGATGSNGFRDNGEYLEASLMNASGENSLEAGEEPEGSFVEESSGLRDDELEGEGSSFD